MLVGKPGFVRQTDEFGSDVKQDVDLIKCTDSQGE